MLEENVGLPVYEKISVMNLHRSELSVRQEQYAYRMIYNKIITRLFKAQAPQN